jgi:transketolase C-terminal domain/subunit
MAMMGMAIGLAMDNKIPFVYSITQAMEVLRLNLLQQHLEVDV